MRSFLNFRTGLGTCPTLNVGDPSRIEFHGASTLLGGCNIRFGVYYTPRGYEKPDVASYLACLSRPRGRQVCLEGVVAGRNYYPPPTLLSMRQRGTSNSSSRCSRTDTTSSWSACVQSRDIGDIPAIFVAVRDIDVIVLHDSPRIWTNPLKTRLQSRLFA